MPTASVRSLDHGSGRFGLALAAVLLAVSALVISIRPASAAECIFSSNDATAANDFNDAGNWSCAAVPQGGDDVVIPSGTSTVATALDIFVNSVSSSGTFTLGASTLHSTTTLTVSNGGLLIVTTGSISVTSTVALYTGGEMRLTTGSLFFDGNLNSTGTISTTGAANLNFGGIFRNAGTLTLTSANVTTTGNIFNLGTITAGSGTFTSIANFTNTGTYAAGSGTFRLAGAADQSITGVAFNNLQSDKTDGIATIVTSNATVGGTLVSRNAGTISSGALNLTVTGVTTNGGSAVVTSTTGVLTFTGAASSTGSIGTISGGILFSSTFVNNGTLDISAGTVTSTGHSTTTAPGTVRFNTGTYSVGGDFWMGGTFTVGTGKVRFSGSSDQFVPGLVYYNLDSIKTGGTATFYSSSTVSNAFATLDAGTIRATTTALTVLGTSTIGGTATVTSTSGTLTFTGAASSTGTIISNTGNILFGSTFRNNGTLTVGTGTATTTGALTNAGTIAVGAGKLEVPSTMTNTGTITRSTGTILHTAESVKLTDSAGTETATFSNGDSMYVSIQDANRNLLGATVESFSVTVTSTAAAGGDMETVTLYETTASSGIFRGGLPVTVATVSIGNHAMDLSGTGVGYFQYADNQDAADTGADSAALSATVAAVATTGGGGLSSGGGGGSIPLALTSPATTQTNTALLQNLTNIGLQVHYLVKLADDNNANTQYDTAVYYVGADGKRHAFPNDKVYFTWYSNFDAVRVISEAKMASIPLGANITYKPGKKMVKFTTDAKVYAVGKGGVLRWVTTEEAAVAMYGTSWNQKIDDINDAFFTNYQFGQNVSGLADFNPATVEASVTYPSDSLAQ